MVLLCRKYTLVSLFVLLIVLTIDEGIGISSGRVVKGNRNAVFLLDENNIRHHFPDFHTFSAMGFNSSMVETIPDDKLNSYPIGDLIQAIPMFRPEDYALHEYCDDPKRMVSDLGLVPNMGNFRRHLEVLKRVKESKSIDILALGGSITAGGYFQEFGRLLGEQNQFNVTMHNHGHGATEITYTIYCVDIDHYKPDLVLIDFAVNDYGHPKLMDALLRKTLAMASRPIVVLVNLWVHIWCPTPRYLLHSFHYQIPVINICPAVNVCFGRARMPKTVTDEYSKTDGVHPWGVKGVPFIGSIMHAWWMRYEEVIHEDSAYFTSSKSMTVMSKLLSNNELPPPLFTNNPIGTCTRCDALAGDSDARLTPVNPPKGFRVVTRVKVGYGGFHPEDKNSSTRSFKRSWQADKAGSSISFRFFGSSVKLAMWQRRDGMGILHATLDDDPSKFAAASGFFKGYTWAMEKNNTGRSEIVTLFEGLADKEHVLTLTVSEEAANVWVKGHTCQIFALLSASDNPNCKTMALG